MRINRLPLPSMIVCLLLSLDVASATIPSQDSNVKSKRVRVYLRNDNIEQPTPHEFILGLVPVTRRVDAARPARGALNALIAGPTAAEMRRGFGSPHAENLAVTYLRIKNGVARVSLNSIDKNILRWPGDTAPERFKEAVTRTLKQFPTVKRVVICLDGELNFETMDERRKKCR